MQPNLQTSNIRRQRQTATSHHQNLKFLPWNGKQNLKTESILINLVIFMKILTFTALIFMKINSKKEDGEVQKVKNWCTIPLHVVHGI